MRFAMKTRQHAERTNEDIHEETVPVKAIPEELQDAMQDTDEVLEDIDDVLKENEDDELIYDDYYEEDYYRTVTRYDSVLDRFRDSNDSCICG